MDNQIIYSTIFVEIIRLQMKEETKNIKSYDENWIVHARAPDWNTL